MFTAYTPGAVEAEREFQIPGSWSFRWLLSQQSLWALGIELRFYENNK